MELNQLFDNITEHATKKRIIQMNNSGNLAEITMEYGEGIGITLRGEMDENNYFHMEHYFPVFLDIMSAPEKKWVLIKE